MHCPNAAEPIALNALRKAASYFCDKTRCWREVMELEFRNDPVRPLPAYQSLVAIEHAFMTGQPDHKLKPIAFSDTVKAGYNSSTVPRYITQANLSTIMLHPAPALEPQDASLSVTVSFWAKPNQVPAYGIAADEQNVLPDFVVEEHCDAIAQGALAKVFLLNDESVFNPDRAALCQTQFLAAIADAQDQYVRGQQRTPLRVTGHYF